MPIIRKVIQVGGSKAVSIPKSWLEFWEKKHGVKITEVTIEVNGSLTIEPIIPEKKKETENHE